jgi:Tol biopolymer transport system component
VGWISWAPDGNRFVYEFRKEIFVYDVLGKTTTRLVEGSNPVWSPDGKWIGFQSTKQEAQIIDPKTKESRTLIAGRKVLWGIHWSPDSAYVMFAEPRAGWVPLRGASTQLVVYRLRDGANTPVYTFGLLELGSDGGFFWVKDIQQFMKNAAIPPRIQPCREP